MSGYLSKTKRRDHLKHPYTFPVGPCAKTENSWRLCSACSPLPVWAALRDLGDGCQTLIQFSDLNAAPTLGSRLVRSVPLGSPREQWPGFTLVRSFCPSASGSRIRSMQLRLPGHQKIHISEFNAGEFEVTVAEKRLIPNGCGVKDIPSCGLLDKCRTLHS